MEETISILVPMYNVQKYIARCIRSLINQTYKNIKIIIVNDGSTDNSNKIAMDFAEKDSRIILFQKKNTNSLSDTRNFLLSKVETKYFIFVDSDDFVEKQYVERLYRGLIETKADCCACGSTISKDPFSFFKYMFTKKIEYKNNNVIEKLIFPKTIQYVLWNKIFRTELASDLRFNTDVNFGEDLQFCLNYMLRCKKIYYFSKPLYHYTLRRGSTIHKKFNQQYINFAEMLQQEADNQCEETNKKVLLAWLSYTSLYYLYLMDKSKYKDDLLRKRYINNIKLYDKYFKEYKKDFLYNLSHDFLKSKYKKELE